MPGQAASVWNGVLSSFYWEHWRDITGGTSAAGRVHCASDAEGREKGGPRGHSSSLAGPRHNRPASAGRACAVPYCGRGTSSHLPLHSEHTREAEGDTAGSLLPDFSPDHLRQICL